MAVKFKTPPPRLATLSLRAGGTGSLGEREGEAAGIQADAGRLGRGDRQVDRDGLHGWAGIGGSDGDGAVIRSGGELAGVDVHLQGCGQGALIGGHAEPVGGG